MVALIYKPTKSAMQSGEKGKAYWVLQYPRKHRQEAHEVMGWVGNQDMNQEIYLHFASKEDAVNYADRHAIEYNVKEPKKRKISLQSYADNFK